MSDQQQLRKYCRKIDWRDLIDNGPYGDRVELGPEPEESGFDPEEYDNAGSVVNIRIGLANCPTTEEGEEGGL